MKKNGISKREKEIEKILRQIIGLAYAGLYPKAPKKMTDPTLKRLQAVYKRSHPRA